MSSTGEVMIDVDRVTKYYGTLKALDNISFKLHRGEVLGFLGPNGAGKTTTMKILTCYFSPSSGKVKVRGLDVFDKSREVRALIGYLPENAPLYGEMTAREYLEFVGDVREIPHRNINSRINSIAEVCGLTDVLEREIRTLSKGYRQRVGLAQAMIHDPEVIILDEPTSGLDPNQIVEIRKLIKEIGKEKTIILSTHNLSEVQVTCNRVIIIHKGKIVANSPTDKIQQQMGPSKFKVVFKKNGISKDEIAEQLKSLSGVSTVSESANPEEGTISFDIDGKGDEDLRVKFFDFAVEKKLKLLELRREKLNLESIFMEITQE